MSCISACWCELHGSSLGWRWYQLHRGPHEVCERRGTWDAAAAKVGEDDQGWWVSAIASQKLLDKERSCISLSARVNSTYQSLTSNMFVVRIDFSVVGRRYHFLGNHLLILPQERRSPNASRATASIPRPRSRCCECWRRPRRSRLWRFRARSAARTPFPSKWETTEDRTFPPKDRFESRESRFVLLIVPS